MIHNSWQGWNPHEGQTNLCNKWYPYKDTTQQRESGLLGKSNIWKLFLPLDIETIIIIKYDYT